MPSFSIGPSVWKVAPVADAPTVCLVSWSILETDKGSLHFAGYIASLQEGSVSTAITTLDVKQHRGVSASGRVYEFGSSSGMNPDAEHAWSRWCRINGVLIYRDVTQHVLENAEPGAWWHLPGDGRPPEPAGDGGSDN